MPGLKRTALPGVMLTSVPVRGIAANACFTGADAEYAKSAQFDALTGGQGLFQALEDRIHRSLCLRPR